MLYLHPPWIKIREFVVVLICAGLFLFDKCTCVVNYAGVSLETIATVVPLANGSTRITLNHSVPGAIAGSYAFLWLPCVRPYSHPCMIVSANPVTFILKARESFTKDPNQRASNLMNMTTPATIDGAYGAVPLFESDAVAYPPSSIEKEVGKVFSSTVSSDAVPTEKDAEKASVQQARPVHLVHSYHPVP